MEQTKLEVNSIFEVLEKSPKFSTFVKACKYTGLDEALRSGGPYTLFIPSDDAFRKLPEGVVEAFYLPENKNKLLTILTYHIIPIKLSSRDLKLGKMRTLSGKKCEFNKRSGGLAIDQSIIAHFDVECTNGVIHVLEQVIFPKL